MKHPTTPPAFRFLPPAPPDDETEAPARDGALLLLTVWGSLLYLDHGTGEICHGGIEGAPANLFLQVASDSVSALRSPAAEAGFTVASGRLVPATSAGSAWACQAEPLGGRRIALRAGGDTLIASRDGGVRVVPASGNAAECFAPLTPADHATLRTLARGAWYSASHRAVMAAGSVLPLQDFMLSIGGMPVPLDDVLAAEGAGERGTRRLALLHDVWRVETLRAFRPLVVFIAGGGPVARDALALALRALRGIGSYAGPVAVLDGEADAGWTQLSRLDALAPYQPILCLDAHIVCDAPIQRALERCFLADSIVVARDRIGAASFAVLGASSVERVETALALAGLAFARARHGEAVDQALGVLRRLGALDFGGFTVATGETGGAGFADFGRTAGGGLPAVSAMRRYVVGLEKKKAVLF